MNQHNAQGAAQTIAQSRFGPGVQVEAVPGPGAAVFRLRLPDATKILKLGRGPEAGSLRKEHLLMQWLRTQDIPVAVVEHAALDADPPYLVMASAGDWRDGGRDGRPGPDRTRRGGCVPRPADARPVRRQPVPRRLPRRAVHAARGSARI